MIEFVANRAEYARHRGALSVAPRFWLSLMYMGILFGYGYLDQLQSGSVQMLRYIVLVVFAGVAFVIVNDVRSWKKAPDVRSEGIVADATVEGGHYVYSATNCSGANKKYCSGGFKINVHWKDADGADVYGIVDVSNDFARKIIRNSNDLERDGLVLTINSTKIKYVHVQDRPPPYRITVVDDVGSVGFGCGNPRPENCRR